MRNTCFGCEHVGKQKIAMGGCVAYCKSTGLVIPQKFSSEPPEITYWRIPLNCPLPDSEVSKSEDTAPEKDWKTESLA